MAGFMTVLAPAMFSAFPEPGGEHPPVVAAGLPRGPRRP